jgi:hypothetical protein
MKTVQQLFTESSVSECDFFPAMGRHDFGPSVNGPQHEKLIEQAQMLKAAFFRAS